MSLEDIAACNRYAFEASFIPDEARKRIWDRYFLK
jgi:hypothetical protein